MPIEILRATRTRALLGGRRPAGFESDIAPRAAERRGTAVIRWVGYLAVARSTTRNSDIAESTNSCARSGASECTRRLACVRWRTRATRPPHRAWALVERRPLAVGVPQGDVRVIDLDVDV
jgi:hypothetical protein